MRIPIGVYLAIPLMAAAVFAASNVASDKAEGGPQVKKDAKHSVATPKAGIKTPGVQILFASLKAEAEVGAAPAWIGIADSLLLPNAAKGTLDRLDPKANKLGDPVAELVKPCGGAITAFGSVWVPSCASQSLVRLDPKTWKVTAKAATGVGSAQPALAASADSVWVLSDDKTTLSRVDPDQNLVVAELRLPAGCNTLTFGETALWVTCPSQDRLLRINPQTNLVEKYIEVSGEPEAVAIGENSIWVYCRKEGKVERIDPKTNKSTKTIETGVPAAAGGIAIGLGSVWVTQEGFPLTRIDPQTEKVVQQFWGPGGGAIQVAVNSVWLTNLNEKTLWRIDPKRVAATLAE
jgi:virginiamycin B lyase